MDFNAYKYVKSCVLNYKLETCCCLTPIRVGLFIIGYINVLVSIITLIGTAEDNTTSPLMEVQSQILEDNASKAGGLFAYSIELVFSAILLCGIYRKDLVLMQVYVYFLVTQIIMSVLFYSIVFVAISLPTKMLIIIYVVYNCYVVLVVRSAIVEIKSDTNEKPKHVVLYSVTKVADEEKPQDIEAAAAPAPTTITENEKNQEVKPDEKVDVETPAKLETVTENPKDDSKI